MMLASDVESRHVIWNNSREFVSPRGFVKLEGYGGNLRVYEEGGLDLTIENRHKLVYALRAALGCP